jgi:hypothetical protein
MAPAPEQPSSLFHGGRDRVSFGGSGGDWEVLEDDDDEEVKLPRHCSPRRHYVL